MITSKSIKYSLSYIKTKGRVTRNLSASGASYVMLPDVKNSLLIAAMYRIVVRKTLTCTVVIRITAHSITTMTNTAFCFEVSLKTLREKAMVKYTRRQKYYFCSLLHNSILSSHFRSTPRLRANLKFTNLVFPPKFYKFTIFVDVPFLFLERECTLATPLFLSLLKPVRFHFSLKLDL